MKKTQGAPLFWFSGKSGALFTEEFGGFCKLLCCNFLLGDILFSFINGISKKMKEKASTGRGMVANEEKILLFHFS